MKYIKILGLLAVAASALMAFAGTASADTLTGPAGETTPTIHAVNEGGHVTLANSIANIECSSTAQGSVTSHPAGGAVSGSFSTLTFAPCTNDWHVTVSVLGSLSVETNGGGTGTVKSSGTTVTTTRFGVTCNYATNNTSVGTFTDATKAANKKGTLDISANIPIHSGSSFLCGSGTAAWNGNYETTTALTLDNT